MQLQKLQQPLSGFLSGPLPVQRALPLYHSAELVRFAGENQTDDISPTQEKPVRQDNKKKSWKQKWVYFSPLATLAGGLFLITSGFMSANQQVTVDEPPSVEVVVEDTPSVTASIDNATQTDNSLKEVFSRLGWIAVTAGSLMGTLNGMAAGVRQKQPSMTLGSLIQTATLPLLVIDPTIPVRAAFFAAAALFTSGLSNKIKNDYASSETTGFREWDLEPLWNAKQLSDLTQSDPSLKSWLNYLKNTTGFVVEDQKNLVLTSATMAKNLLQHPTTPYKNMRQFLKDWHQAEQKSTVLPKPNHQLMKLGAMLTYAGSVPILFLAGRSDLIQQVGSALIASGTLTNNSTLFMLGASESGLHHKSLMVGIPLNVAGTAFMANDIGMGVSLLGGAGISNYFAHLAHTQSPSSQSDELTEKMPLPHAEN